MANRERKKREGKGREKGQDGGYKQDWPINRFSLFMSIMYIELGRRYALFSLFICVFNSLFSRQDISCSFVQLK